MPGNTNDESRLLTENPELIETNDTIVDITGDEQEQIENENILQLLIHELKKMGKKKAFDLVMVLTGAVSAYELTDLLHNEREIAQRTFKGAAGWRIFLGLLSMVPKSQNAEWWVAISKIILNLIYVAGTVEVNAAASIYNGDVSLWAAEFPNKLPMGCFLTSAAGGTLSALCETLRLSCVKDSKMYNFWQNLELFFGGVCTLGATIGAVTLFDVKGLAAPLAGPVLALVDGVTGVYVTFNAVCTKIWNNLSKKNEENVLPPTVGSEASVSPNTANIAAPGINSTVLTSQVTPSTVASDTLAEVTVHKMQTNETNEQITTEQEAATFNADIINSESSSSAHLGVPKPSNFLPSGQIPIYTTNFDVNVSQPLISEEPLLGTKSSTSNFVADNLAMSINEEDPALLDKADFEDFDAMAFSRPARNKGSFID